MATRINRSFLPSADAELLAWSTNFKTMIAGTPATYGLTAAQASEYATVQDTYATTFQVAKDPSTRTRPTVADKDAAKSELQISSRLLAKIVEGTASVTDAQKLALGLTVRKSPTSRPAPDMAPIVEVMAVSGRSIKIRLHGDEPSRRGRPVDVAGASFFTFVGENPSEDKANWKFEGSTTKMIYDIEMASSVAPGSRVWVSAYWFNAKSESGPMSQPAATFTAFGMTRAA